MKVLELLNLSTRTGNFILEMNTRFRSSTSVTEVQTGIDIVKEQLWIAYSGETALKQSDIDPRGHSIECRINAENPALDFQPSPGVISGINVGFRTRVEEIKGCKIPYYIIAKHLWGTEQKLFKGL